jgi:predicted metalloprotease with PDZ domain
LDVEATVPTAGQQQVELMMPVWTPGSYRREELRRFEVTLGSEPPRQWTLKVRSGTTVEQQNHLRQWLSSR